MAFADKLSEISKEARSPKEFDENRLNYFLFRFKYHCEVAAQAGSSSFQMEYIEEYKDGYDMSIGRTIFILSERPYMKWNLMGTYRNIDVKGVASVDESTFPLNEIVCTLKKKLHDDGFKNLHIDIIQKPYHYKGRIFEDSIDAKLIRVSVSW